MSGMDLITRVMLVLVYCWLHFVGVTHCFVLVPFRPLPQASHRLLISNIKPYIGSGWQPARRCHSLMDRSFVNADDEFELILDDFDEILEAVQVFQQIYGNCNIPSKFEVPAERPWPPLLHGLRLGRRLEKLQTSQDFMQKHPDKVKELAAVGWDPHSRDLIDDWDLLLQCLELYKQQHGDLRIPAKFVVPNEAPWPQMARGLRLGVRVAAVRSAGRYVKENPARKAVLDKMGFQWRIRDATGRSSADEAKFQQIVTALTWYKKIEQDDDFQIHPKYAIPDAEEWPEELRGMKLGYQVNLIRSEGKYIQNHPDRARTLADLGFPLQPKDNPHDAGRRFDAIYAALLTYRDVYGDVDVPPQFVVPSEGPWLQEAWGMKLGKRVQAIKVQGTFVANSPDRRAKLDAIGFSWEVRPAPRRRRSTGDVALPTSASPAATHSIDTTSTTSARAAPAQQSEKVVGTSDRSLTNHKYRSPSINEGTLNNKGNVPTPTSSRWEESGTEDWVEVDEDLLNPDARESQEVQAKEMEEFEREMQRLFGSDFAGISGGVPAGAGDVGGAGAVVDLSASTASTARPDQKTPVTTSGGKNGRTAPLAPPGRDRGEQLPLDGDHARAVRGVDGDMDALAQLQSDDADEGFHAIPNRLLIPRTTYDEASGKILPFDLTRMFAPDTYRETAAATILDYYREREASPDPIVRERAPFEGRMSPQELNELLTRPIDGADVAYMQREGYRILEFGRFHFDDIVQALQVYKAHYGHVDVPKEYVVTAAEARRLRERARADGGGGGSGGGGGGGDSSELTSVNGWRNHLGDGGDETIPESHRQVESADGYGDDEGVPMLPARRYKYRPAPAEQDSPQSSEAFGAEAEAGIISATTTGTSLPTYEDRFIGMPLGEAVLSLRIGDIDGLEDPVRRPLLDALGFEWGDKSRHLRFRFVPLRLGLQIYRHLYGFPLVRTDFVVPAEPQWPIWMAGMPLGEWAAVARVQQALLREHYPQRVAMLNALEFLWWIPPAATLPEKYYKPLE